MKLLIDYYALRRGVSIPRGYRCAYTEWVLAIDVYYPIPIHLLVRYARKFYWGFLRAFWWVGLIDTKKECEFVWDDFYRIRGRK